MTTPSSPYYPILDLATVHQYASVPLGSWKLTPKVRCVYFVFVQCGQLAYIGSTYNLLFRLKAHVRSKPWERKTSIVYWIPIQTRNLKRLEQSAIFSLKPMENIRSADASFSGFISCLRK